MALILLSGLSAAEQPKFAAVVSVEKAQDGTAYVVLNGRKAIQLQKPNGSLSPAERARIIAQRLTALLPKITDLKAISSRPSGKDDQLIVSGTVVAIATPEEAKARGMTTSKLAAMWAENLRKILSEPPISVEPASLLIPLGEKRALKVKAYIPGEISADISDGTIISADSSIKLGSLVIQGLAVGDARISIRCGGREVSVPVSVRKYAASVWGTGKGAITGRNPPASLLDKAARDVVRSVVTTEPGASISKIEPPKTAHMPMPGHTSELTMMVEAQGQGYIPARFPAQVEVENRRLPPAESGQIWFSNFPETLRKYQVLFTGRLATSQESTRLLYHHYNDMPQCVGFVIDVINPSAQPAELHVIEGISDPMADVVIVGYVAGKEFLNCHQANIGRIFALPAGTRRVLVSQAVTHPKTASGIMEFRQLSGEPLIVRLVAKPEEERLSDDLPGIDLPLVSFDGARIGNSDGVFPRPREVMDVTYTVGKQWAFIRLGKHPIKHETLDTSLYAFGITYDVNATLVNPTDQDRTIELLFEATAGPAAGVFLLDGKYAEVKRLGPPDERVIGSYLVRSGKTRNLHIRTIPLSGSAYPATLIIRAAK